MTTERIIDRIRKLLELSHSNNEHEAATAAARAAELMSEHEIDEAMLQVSKADDEPAPYIAERVVEEGLGDEHKTERRVAWRDIMLSALAVSLDCERYVHEGNLVVFGRESAVATWRYVGLYLIAEVDRLADEAWLREGADLAAVGQRPRVWKAAFRVGAADVVSSRLYAEVHDRKKRERAVVEAKAKALAAANGETPDQPLALVRVESAIALIQRDRAALAEKWKARGKALRLRSAGSIGNSSRQHRSGYSAGREAGATVNIKGGGKAIAGGGK